MKKKAFIIFNDAHLKTGNEAEVLKSVRHMINYCTDNKIENVVFAGDLFDSRSFQRQFVLETFDQILHLFDINNIILHLFPGNHDKTLYNITYSFLNVFRFHPNVKFYDDLSLTEINGISVTFLPFFIDEMLVERLEDTKGSDLLISHFEIAGSSHLGRVSEKKTIPRGLLKKFKKTYLGHFHNTHEITKDIIHLPSLRQKDFGEDSSKGFSVIYDDLSYKIIKGDFRLYDKVLIDLDTITPKAIKELIKTHENSADSIRFEVVGEEAKVKSFDRSQFKGTGIDLKVKHTKIFDEKDLVLPTLKEEYKSEDIKKVFFTFCEQKGLDYKEGEKLLVKHLTK